jgi:hypothetical protein
MSEENKTVATQIPKAGPDRAPFCASSSFFKTRPIGAIPIL